MKDLSSQSKIYSFSVLDDISDLELASDAVLQNIKINDEDDARCYVQALYNTIMLPRRGKRNKVSYDLNYAMWLYNVLNIHRNVKHSKELPYGHIEYIDYILNELALKILNTKDYTEYCKSLFDPSYKLISSSNKEIVLPEFMFNIISTLYYAYNSSATLFTILTYKHPYAMIDFIKDIMMNKYGSNEKCSEFENILKYSI